MCTFARVRAAEAAPAERCRRRAPRLLRAAVAVRLKGSERSLSSSSRTPTSAGSRVLRSSRRSRPSSSSTHGWLLDKDDVRRFEPLIERYKTASSASPSSVAEGFCAGRLHKLISAGPPRSTALNISRSKDIEDADAERGLKAEGAVDESVLPSEEDVQRLTKQETRAFRADGASSPPDAPAAARLDEPRRERTLEGSVAGRAGPELRRPVSHALRFGAPRPRRRGKPATAGDVAERRAAPRAAATHRRARPSRRPDALERGRDVDELLDTSSTPSMDTQPGRSGTARRPHPPPAGSVERVGPPRSWCESASARAAARAAAPSLAASGGPCASSKAGAATRHDHAFDGVGGLGGDAQIVGNGVGAASAPRSPAGARRRRRLRHDNLLLELAEARPEDALREVLA